MKRIIAGLLVVGLAASTASAIPRWLYFKKAQISRGVSLERVRSQFNELVANKIRPVCASTIDEVKPDVEGIEQLVAYEKARTIAQVDAQKMGHVYTVLGQVINLIDGAKLPAATRIAAYAQAVKVMLTNREAALQESLLSGKLESTKILLEIVVNRAKALMNKREILAQLEEKIKKDGSKMSKKDCDALVARINTLRLEISRLAIMPLVEEPIVIPAKTGWSTGTKVAAALLAGTALVAGCGTAEYYVRGADSYTKKYVVDPAKPYATKASNFVTTNTTKALDYIKNLFGKKTTP